MRLNSVILNTMRRGAIRLSLLGVLCLATCLTSCESLYDDQSDCRSGIALRFVYDYHMEPGANAFPANVDCVTVLVFDTLGNYVTQFKETSNVLRDETYRMDILLDPGTYHLVVYGGLTCDHPAFDFTPDFNAAQRASSGYTKDDILVSLPLEDGVSANQLHDIDARTGGLFYGTQNITVTADDRSKNTFRTETVKMMKDTNNIQVILQEIANPDKMNVDDYHFYIIDDNFLLNGYNKPVYISNDGFQPQYQPYHAENRIMGYVEYKNQEGALLTEDEQRPVQVACAEFSTSRLFANHVGGRQNGIDLPTARLIVTSSVDKDDNGNDRLIIDIPLIPYLIAIRGFGDTWIKSDQEFLDRQSRWTLMFFLQRNAWVSTRIAVNSWVVRINNIELDF